MNTTLNSVKSAIPSVEPNIACSTLVTKVVLVAALIFGGLLLAMAYHKSLNTTPTSQPMHEPSDTAPTAKPAPSLQQEFASALLSNNFEDLQSIIDRGKGDTPINTPILDGGYYYTPLSLAVRKKNLKMVNLLLNHSPNLQQDPKPLLRNGDDWGFTPIHHAVLSLDVEILETLLNYFKNDGGIHGNSQDAVNMRDNNDFTPLRLALSSLHSQWWPSSIPIGIFEILIKHGADVNDQPFSNSKTILMDAAARGRNDVVELLLKKGAVATTVVCDRTALQWAVAGCCVRRKQDNKLIHSLKDQGLNIDLKDSSGRTQLYRACEPDILDKNKIKLLLKHGANPDIQANDGKTAAQIYTEKTEKDINHLIEESK